MNDEKELEEYDLQKMTQMNQGAQKLMQAYWAQLETFKEGDITDGRDTD